MMRCPLCGFEFDETRADCRSSCALAKGCSAIACPNCRYEFVQDSRLVAFVKKLFRKKIDARKTD